MGGTYFCLDRWVAPILAAPILAIGQFRPIRWVAPCSVELGGWHLILRTLFFFKSHLALTFTIAGTLFCRGGSTTVPQKFWAEATL